jgi:hypothetical protein
MIGIDIATPPERVFQTVYKDGVIVDRHEVFVNSDLVKCPGCDDLISQEAFNCHGWCERCI